MPLLMAYDAWFERRVEALLKWLDDWLSISQKYAERGMIAIYLLLVLGGVRWSLAGATVWALVGFSLGCVMWVMHRKPAARRSAVNRPPWYAAMRVFLKIFLLSLAAPDLWPSGHWATAARLLAQQLVYIVFFYATDITFDGGQGRKRKLAWEELKKLFGAEWMPKPIEAPQ